MDRYPYKQPKFQRSSLFEEDDNNLPYTVRLHSQANPTKSIRRSEAFLLNPGVENNKAVGVEIKGSGKNPCDRRFRNKHDIVKYITHGIISDPRQKSISRSEMFSMLLKLSESTKEYYEDKEITLHAFGNILNACFNKDELCTEIDKSFYGI